MGAVPEPDGTSVLLSKHGLDAGRAVLRCLIPEFSAEQTVPRHVVPHLRGLLVGSEAISIDKLTEARLKIGTYAPEVFNLVYSEFTQGSVPARLLVCSFLLAICSLVEDSYDLISVPPWELIVDTYNPASRGSFSPSALLFLIFLKSLLCVTHIWFKKTGVALYFNDSGQQGRYTRRYRTRVSGGTTLACKHKFPPRKKKTGGIFNWFCPHGYGYGTSIIKHAEGRKDAMLALYTHCEVPPQVIIYDFACQLEEYCRNREPTFFLGVL